MKTLYLKAGEEGAVEKAAEILKNGGVVAVPTETVYGLAADALNPAAVEKIFKAKGRPRDNPLIVHATSLGEIEPLVEKIDPRLYDLAEKYWPGPLTVIMKKSELVPDEVTAGLDTVAVRLPSHKTARAIIAAAGTPLAAPSANSSGKPSPTEISHVIEDLDGKIDAAVDGGKCSVGVESTVVTLASDPPVLLRPGGITLEDLAEVLGEIELSSAVLEKLGDGEKPLSPGMKYKHYAPKAEVSIIGGDFEKYRKFLLAKDDSVCAVCFDGEGKYFKTAIEYGGENDGASQARRLFAALREVDATGCERAFVRRPSSDGVGLAVYNRLLRSAAFRTIDLNVGVPVIGLSGPTGSGKSSAAALFKKKGYYVVDADSLARRAVENPEVLSALVRKFGDGVMENGKLLRRELARRAFASPEGVEALNSITHPEIIRLAIKELRAARDSGAKAAVVDAPLLFESRLAALCDKTIVLAADAPTRIERIMKRDGLSYADAKLRADAQKPEEYYGRKADIIINNGKGGDLAAQIEKIIDREA